MPRPSRTPVLLRGRAPRWWDTLTRTGSVRVRASRVRVGFLLVFAAGAALFTGAGAVQHVLGQGWHPVVVAWAGACLLFLGACWWCLVRFVHPPVLEFTREALTLLRREDGPARWRLGWGEIHGAHGFAGWTTQTLYVHVSADAARRMAGRVWPPPPTRWSTRRGRATHALIPIYEGGPEAVASLINVLAEAPQR